MLNVNVKYLHGIHEVGEGGGRKTHTVNPVHFWKLSFSIFFVQISVKPVHFWKWSFSIFFVQISVNHIHFWTICSSKLWRCWNIKDLWTFSNALWWNLGNLGIFLNSCHGFSQWDFHFLLKSDPNEAFTFLKWSQWDFHFLKMMGCSFSITCGSSSGHFWLMIDF